MILKVLRWGVFICGAALLAVVAVGAARGWKNGLTVLGVIGIVCLLLALIADRIRGVVFKHGKSSVRFELSEEVKADLAETGLAGSAAIYSFVHYQLGNDPASYDVKVELQDAVVETVKRNAFSHPVDSEEIDKVLESGSQAERVLVFGLLQNDSTLATLERLRRGIRQSKSGNEQYHALKAALKGFGGLPPGDQKELQAYVRDAPYVNEDKDRQKLASKILAK
jgi:hypothetical protein